MKKRFLIIFLALPVLILFNNLSSLACPYVDHSGYHTHYMYNPIYVTPGANQNDVQWAFTPWMDRINSVGGPFYYYTVSNYDAPNKVLNTYGSGIARTTRAINHSYMTILYFTIEYNPSLSWCMGELMPEIYCPYGPPSFWAVMTHEAGHAVGFTDTTQACSCPGFQGSPGWLDAFPTMAGQDNGCVNGGFMQPYILFHTLSTRDLEAVDYSYSGVVLVEEPYREAFVSNRVLNIRMSRDYGRLSSALIYGSGSPDNPRQLGNGVFEITDEPSFYGYRVPLSHSVEYIWYKLTANNDLKGPFEVTGGSDMPQPLIAYSVQAHPNPFNPKTTIRYNVPSADQVKLGVFDLKGRLIKDLFSGPIEAGEHTAVWTGLDGNGQAASAGTYIVKLETPGRISTHKITMVK